MKLLLDTQCWLWWFAQPNRLNQEAIAQIADEANELWLSVASIWEISIKVSIGKLPLPEPVDLYVSSRIAQLSMRSLVITAAHTFQIAALPLHHRDPFDRLLITQAQTEKMTLVSADQIFDRYSVSLLWAGNS
ncbi:type II toxin-antitoxin system VapC family toxin [Leptolyngbyaceae cyanobacterium UHCC 1019]